MFFSLLYLFPFSIEKGIRHGVQITCEKNERKKNTQGVPPARLIDIFSYSCLSGCVTLYMTCVFQNTGKYLLVYFKGRSNKRNAKRVLISMFYCDTTIHF